MQRTAACVCQIADFRVRKQLMLARIQQFPVLVNKRQIGRNTLNESMCASLEQHLFVYLQYRVSGRHRICIKTCIRGERAKLTQGHFGPGLETAKLINSRCFIFPSRSRPIISNFRYSRIRLSSISSKLLLTGDVTIRRISFVYLGKRTVKFIRVMQNCITPNDQGYVKAQSYQRSEFNVSKLHFCIQFAVILCNELECEQTLIYS